MLRWRMPAAYLRRKRDQRTLPTASYCLLAGLVTGTAFFAGPFWHAHNPLTSLDVLLAAIGFSVVAVCCYIIIPYRSPLITLYKNDIYFERSASNLYYRDIETCSLHRETYKGASFIVMKISPKQGAKVESWINKPMLEIGIPNSIDCQKLVQVLEDHGIKVTVDMTERIRLWH